MFLVSCPADIWFLVIWLYYYLVDSLSWPHQLGNHFPASQGATQRQGGKKSETGSVICHVVSHCKVLDTAKSVLWLLDVATARCAFQIVPANKIHQDVPKLSRHVAWFPPSKPSVPFALGCQISCSRSPSSLGENLSVLGSIPSMEKWESSRVAHESQAAGDPTAESLVGRPTNQHRGDVVAESDSNCRCHMRVSTNGDAGIPQ